jgi:signal transduction histidine kinase
VETLARKVLVGTTGVAEVHALTHDVSGQTDLTDDLVRAHGRLERRLDDLALRDLALTRFAAYAAHDLRAPLQAITGFAELLARREGEALDEESQQILALITGTAGDMGKLIEAALAHAQATAAGSAFTFVDCATLLSRTMLRIDAEIARTGATVEIGDLPVVYAEPDQLSRVLQNLISNACKSAMPGRTAHVVVSAARLSGAWQLSVTDDGAGVPAEDRERIFQLFKRGRRAKGDGGVGIGLAICQTIVEHHGGRIWVEDAQGGGSRFSFFLPDGRAEARKV